VYSEENVIEDMHVFVSKKHEAEAVYLSEKKCYLFRCILRIFVTHIF